MAGCLWYAGSGRMTWGPIPENALVVEDYFGALKALVPGEPRETVEGQA